ncbi:Gfo/Idh/MocA family protein [Streptomyces sp. BE303]|uniref:Gfo/Idh/MocA family protein n=1 Tax=Streptomyces sp. BE303 TaxID=3002528 RepID=UPI002E79D277|nr:Gfo/Idh/MocA family oxidoreductase [Streptomyces sp. BE303]MED7953443.1 Gfo/Idh/MocA family oxidoreductase [Streptomyces sp. BE303]
MSTAPGAGTTPGTGAAPLRTAVLGAGWVAREVWVPLLEAHPVFEVAAVVDADPEAARAVAPAGRAVPVAARPEELADVPLDAAVVALPNHLHVPAARVLLRRGVPVFVEKPVCRTGEEARALRAATAPGAGVHAWSAARHRGDVRALAALLPDLGEIRALGLNWTRAAGIPQRDGWFTDRRLAGGGALLDLGWHLLDVGFDLLGWPDVARALGSLSGDWLGRAEGAADWSARPVAPGAPSGRPPGAPAERVEDTARGFLLTTTGVAVTVESRWASHQPLDSTVITVEGSEGVAVLRGTFGFSPHRLGRSSLTVLRRGREESVPLPEEPVGAEYGRQVDELARRLVRARSDGPGPGPGPGPGSVAGTGRAPDSLAEIAVLASCVDRLYASAGRPAPDRGPATDPGPATAPHPRTADLPHRSR